MNFDFPIEIIRTERSKSASIEIEDDTVKVTVPQNLSDLRIEELIKNRTIWIRQKLKIQTETVHPKDKEYVNGESFTYLGRNYRLKCVSKGAGEVKLKNGYLTVTLPSGASAGAAERSVQQSLKNWYQTRALEKLKEKTKRYAAILGVNPQSVDVKEYKARWGSCSSSGDVSYNWRIIIAPHHIVDYIVVHELCHLLEHNHGAKYWKHVQTVIPNYKECRHWLKTHGMNLKI
ncbi:M48 family metallopeptidase [Planktomarina temperata]|nr:M48 family metallopeptidase [Planktomarina temperata]